MRFIEITKIQSEDEILAGVPSEMVRVSISNELTDEEALAQIESIRASTGWTRETTTARVHICTHGEHGSGPCVLVDEADLGARVSEHV